MSDVISLDWIGGQLRAILAEQRTIRAENEILRTAILNSLSEVVRVLNDRIGNFEALMEARVDRMVSLLEPPLTQHGTQLVEQGAELARQGARLDGQGAQLNRIEALLDPTGPR